MTTTVECRQCGRMFQLRYPREDAYCSDTCAAAAERSAENEEPTDG